MKHCNFCNLDYPDQLSFCTKCGGKLVDKMETAGQQQNSGTGTGIAGTQTDGQLAPRPKKKVGKIVKRIAIGMVVVLVLLIMWGTHLMNSTTYLKLNAEGALFVKRGGELEVNIDYDGYYWEISYKPSWVEISEYESSFIIECEPNETGANREDHITVKSGKIVQTLPVGQYGSAQVLKLSESYVTSDRDGGSIYINMETDGSDPKYTCPDFCSMENGSLDGFTLVVKKNNGYSRTGTLEVAEDNVSSTIFIQQEGTCPDCDGRGTVNCSICNGSGSTYWGFGSLNCFGCGGDGVVECASCGGDGVK